MEGEREREALERDWRVGITTRNGRKGKVNVAFDLWRGSRLSGSALRRQFVIRRRAAVTTHLSPLANNRHATFTRVRCPALGYRCANWDAIFH